MKSLAEVQRFAYQTAGPIDLVVNLVINSIIPALVYWGLDTVPIWGSRSLAVVGLPMLTLMPLMTTYFGYRRTGVEARAADECAGVPPFDWQRPAWRSSLIRAACGVSTGAALLWLWTSLGGVARVPQWTAIAGIAWVSAIGAYFSHASAVVQCFHLYKRRERANAGAAAVVPEGAGSETPTDE